MERFIAICYPFLSHTMSNLSRAIKFVFVIWLAALCLAIPQAIQYGMWYGIDEDGNNVSRCTMTRLLVQHSFELSSFVFFVGPMTIISVLYVMIAFKLRHPRLATNARLTFSNDDVLARNRRRSIRNSSSQGRVIKMLGE